MKTALSLLSLVLLTSGCASSMAAKVIKALGNDPASVSVRVNGWGTVIELSRANPAAGMSSTISKDGNISVNTVTTNAISHP